MALSLFVTIFLSVIVAWALAIPHLRAVSDTGGEFATGGVLDALTEQKDRCVQLLKDLELDFSTGKLSDTDYSRMRGALTAELAQLPTGHHIP